MIKGELLKVRLFRCLMGGYHKFTKYFYRGGALCPALNFLQRKTT